MAWKIYYHNPNALNYFSTFSSRQGTPEQAPTQGVLLVLTDGRRISFMDWYFIDGTGNWVGMSTQEFQDYQTSGGFVSSLKQGRWINTERFLDILYISAGDPMFTNNITARKSRLPNRQQQSRVLKKTATTKDNPRTKPSSNKPNRDKRGK